MSETNNDGTTQQGSPAADASPDAGTQEPTATPGEDPIALARKRQAGAEAARQKAEEARDNALKELEVFRAKDRTESDKELADNAKLQERLTAAEARANEAEAKAEARILDIKYPAARAELPEITDEVRLAKLEALLGDGPVADAEPPTPQNPNESNRTASGDKTNQPKPETSADIEARLKAMKPDWS